MAMSPARTYRRKAANVAFIAFCSLVTMIALGSLALILYSLVVNGVSGLNLHVFTVDTMSTGSQGGLRNAIVGSLMMVGLGMVIAVIIGILAGTWLAEYGGDGAYAKLIRFMNDVLLSAPSILIGLFVWQAMVAHLIHHFSGYAGAVALGLLAIPVVTRTTEDVLKLQPTALREAGVALGAPVWTTIRKVLWKAAAGGIVTGGLLAFARISGETAPLLFTALGNNNFSHDLYHAVASLPQVIFNYALSPYDDWRSLAWVGAILITAAVLTAQILARILIREPRRS